MNQTRYIVTPAPGWYGDETRVISSHGSEQAARRKIAGKHWAIYYGAEKAGDRWLRVYAQMREQAGQRLA